eukprot:141321_1
MFMPTDTINSRYSLDFICRIHTYFIHSHHISRLTNDEIKYIEKQLSECRDDNEEILNHKKLQMLSTVINNKKQNILKTIGCSDNSKFMTTDISRERLDYEQISMILANNNIFINQNDLSNVFDVYEYDKQQLINDICDVTSNANEQNILFSQILINELKYKDPKTRETIYCIILYEYIKKEDLNNDNFIKILQIIASKLIPNVDGQTIRTIAQEANLSGKIFIKGSEEFKNASKFAKTFESITNWNKKQWGKVYTTIKKWNVPKTIPSSAKKVEIKQSEDNTIDGIDDTCVLSDDEENKYSDEDEIDYINKGTDDDIIREFCDITTATKKKAIQFLKESEWNVMFAVNKYYGSNGIFDSNSQTDNSVAENNDIQGVVYNHGIAFWYWREGRLDQRYINPKGNLKEE